MVVLGGILETYKMVKKKKKVSEADTFDFPSFEREKIENEINLQKKAEEDAQFKRPTANAKALSICENEGVDKINDLLDKATKEANTWLSPVINTIDELKIKLKQQHFFIQETKNKCNEIIEQAKTTLQTQKIIFDKENHDVDTFRNINNIGRQPNVLTFNLMVVHIGIVIALFAGESVANMFLLADAIGQQGGLAYSMAVAGLNVGISALVGYFILKGAVHLRGATRKWLIFVIVIYGVLISYINLCLGALRSIFENTQQEQDPTGISLSEGAAEGLNPLYFWNVDWTFLSLVLTFVGLLFAVISLIDAYLYNDPYPGYGSTAKKREEARKIGNQTSENLANNITRVFNSEHSKGIHKLKTLIDKDLPTLVSFSNKVTNLFDGYRDYADELERGANHICKEYRNKNENIRTDGVRPAYFDKEYEFTPKLKNPEEVFPNGKAYYLTGDNIQNKIAELQKRLTDEHNQHEKDLNTLKDEIDQKIIKLRETYAFG